MLTHAAVQHAQEGAPVEGKKMLSNESGLTTPAMLTRHDGKLRMAMACKKALANPGRKPKVRQRLTITDT